jgi:hypothetical protein
VRYGASWLLTCKQNLPTRVHILDAGDNLIPREYGIFTILEARSLALYIFTVYYYNFTRLLTRYIRVMWLECEQRAASRIYAD